jgi:type I restriction enzyme S subunit
VIELPQGWVLTKFGNVLLSLNSGLNGKQNKSGDGIPVSRIETIANQRIDMTRIGFLKDYDEEKVEKYQLREGDILFSNINSPAHLGKTALCEKGIELYHGVNLLRLTVNEAIIPSLLNYYCKYIRGLGEFSAKAQHAVNQSSLNQTK